MEAVAVTQAGDYGGLDPGGRDGKRSDFGYILRG